MPFPPRTGRSAHPPVMHAMPPAPPAAGREDVQVHPVQSEALGVAWLAAEAVSGAGSGGAGSTDGAGELLRHALLRQDGAINLQLHGRLKCCLGGEVSTRFMLVCRRG